MWCSFVDFKAIYSSKFFQMVIMQFAQLLKSRGACMKIKQLYSSLNILYLKMFQYRKYMREGLINEILDQLNQDSDWLKKEYDKEYDLSSMSLKEMFKLSAINTVFNHNSDLTIVEDQLVDDLNELHEIRKEVFKRPYVYS